MTTTPQTAAANPVAALGSFGQSVWLDFIRRSLIDRGELKHLVDVDGVTGVTSNPAIFEKAIDGSNDYASAIAAISEDATLTPKEIYEQLAIRDIQDAADVLRPVYDRTEGRDGYVSLEVSPELANDTQGTLDEARRLWATVAKQNVMIKVPATNAGLPAIRALIGEGINVNVTLLFARDVYEAVARAFIEGLEARAASGGELQRIASVASFFVSRIDTAVDAALGEKAKVAVPAQRAPLEALMGKVAIANAKLAYRSYASLFSGARWDALRSKGAQTQRLLWASTGTKNPHYRDVLYVEGLIGPDTVNTVPPETLAAFRDHGVPRASLVDGLADAEAVLAKLEDAGISLKRVADDLLADGLKKFVEPFAKLLKAVERRAREANKARINSQSHSLPAELQAAVAARVAAFDAEGGTRRLFAGDASFWTGADEASWLGWVPIAEKQLDDLGPLLRLRDDARRDGFAHVLLMGMGGSSLCPEVFKETFGIIPGSPELLVLDSTDPAQILDFESRVDLAKTLFIVSSKSGSTLEPNIFKAYFFDRAKKALGAAAAARFIAVTDPASNLEKEASADGFRAIYPGLKSIGGRYSALSNFGMVPAAAMGLDVERLLDEAVRMLQACAPGVPAEENPGLVLGTIMGVLAKKGIDKLTLVASPGVRDLGAWLEQLVAESTGKRGLGIVPVDRERVAAPSVYGNDRLFVYVRLNADPDPAQDAAVAALEAAGRPVVRIGVETRADLAEEFVRWEIATAIAGAVLGINPFDQPDVEASKIATRALTDEYEKSGLLPPEKPFFEADGIQLFTDAANVAALDKVVGPDRSLASYMKAHLSRLGAGDYFGVLAYVQMNRTNEEALQRMRHAVRDARRVATCLGFGPRFLHSTGQAYKGGPNTGVFLQVTCGDAKDVAVPGKRFTFGTVKAAQARGDFQVLAERKRRALRVHLADTARGLRALEDAIARGLA